MKKINKNSTRIGLNFGEIAERLAARARNNGRHGWVSQQAARLSFGLEDMTPAEVEEVEAERSQLEADLSNVVEPEHWNEDLTEAQRDAGVIVAAASGDPESYQAAATGSIDDTDVTFDASSTDVQNIVSNESYDSRTIEEMLPVSIAYNIGAARQDEAMEAVWPTISLSADQAGLEISITRNMIHHHFTHATGPAATEELFGQRNLVHALIDSSILRNQATDIIPVYDDQSDVYDHEILSVKTPNFINSINHTFTPGAEKAHINEGFIMFNTPFNLIGAAGGAYSDPFQIRDMTDTIDSLVRLKVVFVEIETDDGKSYVPLNTLNLEGAQFQKSQEGSDRLMHLAFSGKGITINKTTKDHEGNEAVALSGLEDDVFVALKVSANGDLNLADGNGELTAGSVTIQHFYQSVQLPDGTTDLQRVTEATKIETLKAKFKSMKLRSFSLDARFANLNRRERGLIVRQDVRRVKYAVQLQAPITVLKPVTDTKTQYVVDAAVQAANAHNSVAGVEELMATDALLNEYKNSSSFLEPNAAVVGIGSYMIRPYYERKKVDMTKLVNNMNSHTLYDDITTHLTLLIRDRFAKAMMVSGWMAAQQAAAHGSKEKPTAVIVVDPRVSQYVMVKGDNRTLGDTFNAKVVVSNYLEFRNKIFVVPRRESSVNQPDGLNFGNMFWLPQLVTNMPISRHGQISHEFTVQTRRRHIVHCPLMLRFDLENLDKVIDAKVHTSVVVNQA